MPEKPNNPSPFPDKRKYIRTPGLFPIDFSLVRIQGELMPGVEAQKGFTQNVSPGGLCLETKGLAPETIKFLGHNEIYLDLFIHLPLTPQPLHAICQIAWFEQIKGKTAEDYIIGLEFRKIANADLNLLLKHAGCIKGIIQTTFLMSVVIFMLALVAVMIR